MNLRNVKKVGFIDNFNPRQSYPEFSSNANKIAIIGTGDSKNALAQIVAKKLKGSNKELVEAKKLFNKYKPKNYKPKLLRKIAV